ncbi:unnamed protein product [Urochloa humidicola]
MTGRRGQGTAAAVLPRCRRRLLAPRLVAAPVRAMPPPGRLQDAAPARATSSSAACPRSDGSPAPVRHRPCVGPREPPAAVPLSEAGPALLLPPAEREREDELRQH